MTTHPATGARSELVPTPVGTARLDWFPARGQARAAAVLGHGTATGVEAADLQALAVVLPRLGITVALATQPYRVEGNPKVSDEASLDVAWKALWPFGRPEQFPPLPAGYELVEIPGANHMFGGGFGTSPTAPLERLTGAVAEWIAAQLSA
jgi:hypothetical protein